MVHKVWELGVL